MTVSEILHRRAAEASVPLSGTFELSPVCNFACKMCYVRKSPGQLAREGKGLISWQAWLELAEQCRRAGTLYLLLTGGEPFLYPGFRELYVRLHRMGFVLYINTNGTLIDERTVEWLKQNAPGRVNITLYGASAGTYERICGDPQGYEKAVRAITMLRQAQIPVVINASMIPENAADLEKILDIGAELGLNVRMSTYMFPPVRRTREECDSRFTPEQAAAVFLRKARRQYTPEGYQGLLEKCAQEDRGHGPEFMRCRAGRSSFWVNWEGDMTACGMMDFPLKTKPFADGFQTSWERLTQCVRTTPVLQGCAGCENRELCSPCAAMIYAETGTTDQKSDYLCRMAGCIREGMHRELDAGRKTYEAEV